MDDKQNPVGVATGQIGQKNVDKTKLAALTNPQCEEVARLLGKTYHEVREFFPVTRVAKPGIVASKTS